MDDRSLPQSLQPSPVEGGAVPVNVQALEVKSCVECSSSQEYKQSAYPLLLQLPALLAHQRYQ